MTVNFHDYSFLEYGKDSGWILLHIALKDKEIV